MRYQMAQHDAEDRRTFEIIFPEKVTVDHVTEYLNAIRGSLSSGRWLGTTAVVFELLSSEAGPEWRFRAPTAIADDIRNQLASHIPGVHVEEIVQPTQPAWTVAREFGTSSGRAQLDVQKAGKTGTIYSNVWKNCAIT